VTRGRMMWQCGLHGAGWLPVNMPHCYADTTAVQADLVRRQSAELAGAEALAAKGPPLVLCAQAGFASPPLPATLLRLSSRRT
jgi:hypothetical protein